MHQTLNYNIKILFSQGNPLLNIKNPNLEWSSYLLHSQMYYQNNIENDQSTLPNTYLIERYKGLRALDSG